MIVPATTATAHQLSKRSHDHELYLVGRIAVRRDRLVIVENELISQNAGPSQMKSPNSLRIPRRTNAMAFASNVMPPLPDPRYKEPDLMGGPSKLTQRVLMPDRVFTSMMRKQQQFRVVR